MKVVLDPRTKRKIKKILKSKWTKTVIVSVGVYIVLAALGLLLPMAIVAIAGGTVKAVLLFKASLIINAIVYPLWFKQCLVAVEKHEATRRTNKRRHKESSTESDV